MTLNYKDSTHVKKRIKKNKINRTLNVRYNHRKILNILSPLRAGTGAEPLQFQDPIASRHVYIRQAKSVDYSTPLLIIRHVCLTACKRLSKILRPAVPDYSPLLLPARYTNTDHQQNLLSLFLSPSTLSLSLYFFPPIHTSHL